MRRERQCPQRSSRRETAQLEAPGHAPPPRRRGCGPFPAPSRGRGRSCPRGAQRQPSLREGASSPASGRHSTNTGGAGGSTQNRGPGLPGGWSRAPRGGGGSAWTGGGGRLQPDFSLHLPTTPKCIQLSSFCLSDVYIRLHHAFLSVLSAHFCSWLLDVFEYVMSVFFLRNI